jgi:hypothetical protein
MRFPSQKQEGWERRNGDKHFEIPVSMKKGEASLPLPLHDRFSFIADTLSLLNLI